MNHVADFLLSYNPSKGQMQTLMQLNLPRLHSSYKTTFRPRWRHPYKTPERSVTLVFLRGIDMDKTLIFISTRYRTKNPPSFHRFLL